MNRIDRCPCCGSLAGREASALLAPFIQAWVRPAMQSPVCVIRHCGRCGFMFFLDRFSSEEMQRLYCDYRSSAYLACRSRHEPWYTKAVNDANLTRETIIRRQHDLRSFLQDWLPGDPHRFCAVDVGGDRGQFMPQGFFSDAYLIEAADLPPCEGVTQLASMQDMPSVQAVLLVFSHVLEHLPDPVAFVRAYLSAASEKAETQAIYIEVPLERFCFASSMSSSLYHYYLRLLGLAWMRPWLMLMDALTLLSRGLFRFVCPPMVLKLHEHLNFFSPQSLVELANALDLEVLAVVHDRQSALLSQQGVIRLLAVPRSTI